MTGRVIRLRGIKSYRHPKSRILYHYHRATGTRLKAPYGTAEFIQELRALEEKQKARQAQKAIPGTLGLAIGEWRATPEWSNLKPKTRVSYERAIAVLKPLEGMPLAQITRAFILDLRTKIFEKRGRWMTNYCVTVLRLILGFALDRGWIEANPLAERVKKIRATDEGDMNRPWTEAECKIVLERAPPALKLAL